MSAKVQWRRGGLGVGPLGGMSRFILGSRGWGVGIFRGWGVFWGSGGRGGGGQVKGEIGGS